MSVFFSVASRRLNISRHFFFFLFQISVASATQSITLSCSSVSTSSFPSQIIHFSGQSHNLFPFRFSRKKPPPKEDRPPFFPSLALFLSRVLPHSPSNSPYPNPYPSLPASPAPFLLSTIVHHRSTPIRYGHRRQTCDSSYTYIQSHLTSLCQVQHRHLPQTQRYTESPHTGTASSVQLNPAQISFGQPQHHQQFDLHSTGHLPFFFFHHHPQPQHPCIFESIVLRLDRPSCCRPSAPRHYLKIALVSQWPSLLPPTWLIQAQRRLPSQPATTPSTNLRSPDLTSVRSARVRSTVSNTRPVTSARIPAKSHTSAPTPVARSVLAAVTNSPVTSAFTPIPKGWRSRRRQKASARKSTGSSSTHAAAPAIASASSKPVHVNNRQLRWQVGDDEGDDSDSDREPRHAGRPARNGEMSTLAMLASDELHELQRAEREGRRSGPPSHAYHSHYAADPYSERYQSHGSSSYPYPAVAPSSSGETTPPGCSHEDCHRKYNDRIASAILARPSPHRHVAECGYSRPSHASYNGSHPPPSLYRYYQHGSHHGAGGWASTSSSVPSSVEHSPRFSPDDHLHGDDYASESEHAASLHNDSKSRLPLDVSGSGAHSVHSNSHWTPSSSPVLGPLRNMSLLGGNTVPNSPYTSRPGSPVHHSRHGHGHSPPHHHLHHHSHEGPAHQSGLGHHGSHRHRSHPYMESSARSRSHHHLSSLGMAPVQPAIPPSTSGERSTAAELDSLASGSTATSASTSPSQPSYLPPKLSRSHSFGSRSKGIPSLNSSASLSAYHLTPVHGPSGDAERSGSRRSKIEDILDGGVGSLKPHHSTRSSYPHLVADPSSRTLPPPFPASASHRDGSHHPLPGHHYTHAYNYHPYGDHKKSARSSSRSAPASRSGSPHGSPVLSHALPGLPGSRSHSRQSSIGNSFAASNGLASSESSPTSVYSQIPVSASNSPAAGIGPHAANPASSSSGRSKKGLGFGMTPIHSAHRGDYGPTLPPLGQALSRETSPISMHLPPPMKRIHSHSEVAPRG